MPSESLPTNKPIRADTNAERTSLKATAKASDGKITVVDIKSDDYAAELKRWTVQNLHFCF